MVIKNVICTFGSVDRSHTLLEYKISISTNFFSEEGSMKVPKISLQMADLLKHSVPQWYVATTFIHSRKTYIQINLPMILEWHSGRARQM